MSNVRQPRQHEKIYLDWRTFPPGELLVSFFDWRTSSVAGTCSEPVCLDKLSRQRHLKQLQF